MNHDFSCDGGWHKPIDELTFADDFMFGKIMENKEVCKQVLELLLDIKIGDIKYPKLQDVPNPCADAKSIRLDVFAADGERVFDIEIIAKIASCNFCLRVFDKQKLAILLAILLTRHPCRSLAEIYRYKKCVASVADAVLSKHDGCRQSFERRCL